MYKIFYLKIEIKNNYYFVSIIITMSNTNEVLSDVDSQADTEFEGTAEMPEVSSTDTGTTGSNDSSEYSTEEEKVPEQPMITGIGRGTQTKPPPYCGICYKDLNLENIVNTNCNHQFCKTCFYRWLEVNATCPCCRAPIDSKTNLTDDQLDREMQEVYIGYTALLQRNQDQLGRNEETRVKYYDLREKTTELLKRQIRLREMIEETRGYNEGYMAAAFEFFHGRNKKYTSPLLVASMRKKGFMKGFQTGASRESRRLDRMAKEFKEKARRTVKIKSRPVQQKLWDCGIYEIQPKNPFYDMTVGLSEDEDEEDDEIIVEHPSPNDVSRSDVDEIMEMVDEMTV